MDKGDTAQLRTFPRAGNRQSVNVYWILGEILVPEYKFILKKASMLELLHLLGTVHSQMVIFVFFN